MRRLMSVIDPETNELVTPAVYAARLEQRRGRCRTGSPVVVCDWPQPIRSPLDGSMMTCRADLREQEIKHDVKCAGDAGYLEGLGKRKREYQPLDRKAMLHALLHEHEPVPEKVKAQLEGRLDTPLPLAPPMEVV